MRKCDEGKGLITYDSIEELFKGLLNISILDRIKSWFEPKISEVNINREFTKIIKGKFYSTLNAELIWGERYSAYGSAYDYAFDRCWRGLYRTPAGRIFALDVEIYNFTITPLYHDKGLLTKWVVTFIEPRTAVIVLKNYFGVEIENA